MPSPRCPRADAAPGLACSRQRRSRAAVDHVGEGDDPLARRGSGSPRRSRARPSTRRTGSAGSRPAAPSSRPRRASRRMVANLGGTSGRRRRLASSGLVATVLGQPDGADDPLADLMGERRSPAGAARRARPGRREPPRRARSEQSTRRSPGRIWFGHTRTKLGVRPRAEGARGVTRGSPISAESRARVAPWPTSSPTVARKQRGARFYITIVLFVLGASSSFRTPRR